MLVGHGIGYGILHTYTIIQEYIPVERRNDIRPSASQLDSTIHDVMILLECREIERSGNETARNAGRLDSVDLIRVHTLTRCTIAIFE